MTPLEFAEAFFGGQDRQKGAPPAELLAPTYRAELVGFAPMDAAGHRAFAQAFYAAFPDLRHTVDAAQRTEEGIAVRFTITGTHSGPFMGLAPTGRSVTVACVALMAVHDDLVTQLHGIFDQLGMMRQLGVVPS
jgi:predicted ester cyclase